jgi:phenylacetate-CoA ligase
MASAWGTGLRGAAALPALLWHPRARAGQVQEYRARRLRQVVRHAYRTVPFYRELFDRHGIRPESIRSPDDLWRLPITSRDDVQHLAPDRIVAGGLLPERLILHRTSGSTGRPLTIRRTRLEERVLWFLRYRALMHLGVRPRDVIAVLAFQRPGDRLMDRLRRVANLAGLLRIVKLDCRLPPLTLARRLEAVGADLVAGFPGVLMEVAAAMTANGIDAVRPRLVTTGGEVMTAHMRGAIGRAFRAPVFDLYGCYESGLIASECRHTGDMHVCDDGVIVEVLADGKPVVPGAAGEIVLTTLHSFAMPFIRYRIGDIVTRGAERCSCGQPFSTLRSIQGRMIDYLRLPGGRLLHPYEIVASLLPEYGWIRAFRVVQEHERLIVLEVNAAAVPDPVQVADLRGRIASSAGPDVTVRLELVPAIHREPNGKFRVFRSNVTSMYDGHPVERT